MWFVLLPRLRVPNNSTHNEVFYIIMVFKQSYLWGLLAFIFAKIDLHCYFSKILTAHSARYFIKQLSSSTFILLRASTRGCFMVSSSLFREWGGGGGRGGGADLENLTSILKRGSWLKFQWKWFLMTITQSLKTLLWSSLCVYFDE